MSMALIKSCGNCLAVHRVMAFVINSSSTTQAACFAVASGWPTHAFRCEVNHASIEICYCNRDGGKKREAVKLLFQFFFCIYFTVYFGMKKILDALTISIFL